MAKKIQQAEQPPAKKSRRDRISDLLAKIEDRIADDSNKATLSDLVRLTQLERELEDDEPPREIKVTWINRQEKSDIEK